jgi:HPt (histidine-containing phosphotransfer) domain-containing protein
VCRNSDIDKDRYKNGLSIRFRKNKKRAVGGFSMDFKVLAESIGFKETEFLRVVGLFVKNASTDLTDIQVALGEENMQRVIKGAHSIKGAAVNLGLMDIYEVAKKMDIFAKKNQVKEAEESIEKIREKIDLIAQGLDQRDQ